jgi:hypothetical protein
LRERYCRDEEDSDCKSDSLFHLFRILAGGLASKVRNRCWIKRVGQPPEFKIHNNIACSSSTHPLPQVVLTFIQVKC